jgi:hypothetical protein
MLVARRSDMDTMRTPGLYKRLLQRLGPQEAFGSTNEPTMTKMPHPFALPASLSSDLGRVQDYWDKLKRAENQVPFWDDVNLSALPGLEGRLMLIDVFKPPQRFRLNTVGKEIRDWYGADVVGKFADEIDAKGPLAYFTAQASATVEATAPTYYHDGFVRLLLPLWGDGYVSMLLGTVARG